MTGGGAVPRIFHRRRRLGSMVGGVRPDERALTAHSLDRHFFLVLQGSTTPLVISAIGRCCRKVNCEYARIACCAQFHSRTEFLEAHINAMLSVEGTLM